MRPEYLMSFVAWILVGSAFASPAASKIVPLEYNRDVRPILAENCFVCHGADSASRKAKLRLDSFESATVKTDDGVSIIVPGKPVESDVVRRIFDEGDDLMPPAESHLSLIHI